MGSDDLRFVWLDLEMTGLDVDRCVIVEIGVIVTGADLVPIESYEQAIWQPDSALETMGPFVRKMHEKSGLLPRIRASEVALADAEKAVLALVSKHTRFGKGVLAGNSIHQDRLFLRRYMPAFENFLHYRQVDVSSLKVLAQAWHPERVFEKNDKTHTALDDIRGSLAELAHYRDVLFRP